MDAGVPDRISLHRIAQREAGNGGDLADAVPHRLLASWQRSEEYGIPLDSKTNRSKGRNKHNNVTYCYMMLLINNNTLQDRLNFKIISHL